jgi:2-hydroxychromene-2-carboxylate isomerase
VEFWFDFSCPYAYLASRRVADLAAAAGVTVDYRPMLLGGVFRGIGAGEGPMATQTPARRAYVAQDLARWAEVLGVPLTMPAAHPMRTVLALRTLLALPRAHWPAAIDAIYAAYWQQGADITTAAAIAAALAGAGLPADLIAAAAIAATSDEIKDELHRRTDEAIALGIFGAPACVIRRAGRPPLLFWGQDRLPQVAAVLAGWDPDAAPDEAARAAARAIVAAAPPPAPGAQLELWFDVGSPFAYLGLTQLARAARAGGARPTLHPILLGALFRDIGTANVPLLAFPEAKRRYLLIELERFARWWGEPFAFPRKFPQRTVTAQRLCLLAATDPAHRAADLDLAVALGRAMWVEDRDLEDDATLRAILVEVGLPPTLVELAAAPASKAALVASTAAAQAAGVFGVPTMRVSDGTHRHLFWGQDRLDLVARALAGWHPAAG